MQDLCKTVASVVGIAVVIGLVLPQSDLPACAPFGGQVTGDALTLAKSGKELDKLVWEHIRKLPDEELLKCRESSNRIIALRGRVGGSLSNDEGPGSYARQGRA